MGETVIERVARAMFEAQEGSAIEFGAIPAWPELSDYERNRWGGYARAAIKAMREPTGAMKIAVAHADWIGKQDLNWGDGWRIMADAALKETN